jgi:hypothetical protein
MQYIIFITRGQSKEGETMAARGMGSKYQGSKWLRRERRLGLYLRDGLSCCYCGACVEDGAMLTLDHLIPHVQGGSNENSNLITACRRGNSSRADRTVEAFAMSVANYLNHGITAEQIIGHILETVTRPVDVKAAKALIAARGSFTQALQG